MKGLDRTAGKIRLPYLGERESVRERERERERERKRKCNEKGRQLKTPGRSKLERLKARND